MDKVRLTLGDLQVQSFTTTHLNTGPRGTVRAHDAPSDPVECPSADPAWDTCWGSCGDSCGGTCGGSTCGGSCDCDTNYCSDTCGWGCYTRPGMISVC